MDTTVIARSMRRSRRDEAIQTLGKTGLLRFARNDGSKKFSAPMSEPAMAVRPRGKPERAMSHSLIDANRTTHLKIDCVALVGAMAVVAIGITARVTDNATATATAQVVKTGKPATFTAHGAATIR
jgi:hypothetical protein